LIPEGDNATKQNTQIIVKNDEKAGASSIQPIHETKTFS
jgi:hypothetical protein